MIKKYFFENIFFISLILFLIKWFFFFDTNIEIDLITKIIFEIQDWQYFTLIYNLSNLNFNPSYDPSLVSLKYIALPIYSILYHSIFFNFFNIYGFIIIEFFIIYNFLNMGGMTYYILNDPLSFYKFCVVINKHKKCSLFERLIVFSIK